MAYVAQPAGCNLFRRGVLGVTVIYALLLLLHAQPPQVSDSVVTRVSRSFMHGDTLYLEHLTDSAKVKARQKFLIHGDSVTLLEPAPRRLVTGPLAKYLAFAADDLRQGTRIRRQMRK